MDAARLPTHDEVDAMSGATQDAGPWDVLEAHMDGAELCCSDWAAALDNPCYVLDELAEIVEQRLLAHVDALEIGGPPVAERLLAPALGDDATPARATAAALVALCTKSIEPSRTLVASLAAHSGPALLGVATALAMAARRELSAQLVEVVGALADDRLTTLVPALARGGYDTAKAIDAALTAADPELRIVGARATLGADRRLQPWIERAIASDDEALRVAALPSGLVLGAKGAAGLTAELALRSKTVHRDALCWLALVGDRSTVAALCKRVDDAAARPDVLWALGFSGMTIAADACVAWLADEKLGALAADSFAAITGLDRSDRRWWAPPAAVPSDDDEAARAGVPAGLPLPVPDTVARWWSQHRVQFMLDQRYVLGRQLDPKGLIHALRHESLPRRHVRALDLLIRTQGRAHVHTRTLSGVQRREMAALAGAL
ncbi:MAG: hypothetical protein IPN32_14925 [Deltaproteobacteria bacterium]|nr:hypothetical protein [Deltaproteobacteria bacterium]